MIELTPINMLQGKNPQKMEQWEKLIEHAIIDGVKNEGYTRLTSKSMVGCYLGIYV